MPAQAQSKSGIRIGFFELLFGTDEGCVCIATSDPKAPKSSFEQKFFEWPRESIKMENYILKKEMGYNVYFCINLLKGMERKKHHCLPTNLVWADLDGVNPDTISTIPPPIVVQSSPGRWQAFWRLTTKQEPFEAERYSRRMAYAVGADVSGWDLTQLFRVPLTKNWKYDPTPTVLLERALETKARPILFEALPKTPEQMITEEIELPSANVDPEDIIAKFAFKMDIDRFVSMYTSEPGEDENWSMILWHLIHLCFRAGMEDEEVFAVVRSAACNKYARDGRPIEHLWRDVQKASKEYGSVIKDVELLSMPELVSEPESEDTFIQAYRDWAEEATDAVAEFHELSAFILLSAIVSSSVRLTTSYGPITPNLWGLVLGDSTVTRKTTAMRMAIEFLTLLEGDLILATDGTAEGLITGLSMRPSRVSVFYRDEISGLFDSMLRKDYLSALPEILTNLYDVPPVYSRMLRKEVIRVESPAFIFYGGGIRDRVYSLISEEWITSGFLPRFLVVSGDFDESRMRPTGPPSAIGLEKRAKLVETLADLYQHYAAEVSVKLGGETSSLPPRYSVDMSQEAWDMYQTIEKKLTKEGYNSVVRDTALPTFDRLARSVMKMSMIMAAARQVPVDGAIKVDKKDVVNAAWYAQKFGRHSVDLVLNAGKAQREKYFDRVLAKIKNQPGVLRSSIMQHLHLNKREADEVLFTLEERGQIRKESAGRGWRYWST